MTNPVLATAANGHNWLTFETYGSPQWKAAYKWLSHQQFKESGRSIIGLDEGILPSFVRGQITIETGFDNWSGHYLLAQCHEGDQLLVELAQHLAASDHRGVA